MFYSFIYLLSNVPVIHLFSHTFLNIGSISAIVESIESTRPEAILLAGNVNVNINVKEGIKADQYRCDELGKKVQIFRYVLFFDSHQRKALDL